jgi:predicted dinucleotide-binding enzyme
MTSLEADKRGGIADDAIAPDTWRPHREATTMKIGVLGTGMVGQAIAGKLAELGHAVVVGTRDPAATLARTTPDGMGNPPFRSWREKHPAVELGTFAQAGAHGELVVNATSGSATVAAVKAAGEENLAGKVLIDVSNPLDFSRGRPPSLSVCNTDSLGEQIQRAIPAAKVVKALNIVNASLMVNPRQLADGAHSIFVCGNDAGAKAQVSKLLESFGWQDILDLGDITNARGTEMYLALWVRVFGAVKTPTFSLKIVR